jgi:transposase
MHRTHGRASLGARILGYITGKRAKRTNVIGAWSAGKGLFVTRTYEDITVNRERFINWLRTDLVPHLSKGKIVIMDNASWHKGAEITEIIQKTEATLLYLPPYSPDLNPIEHAWANLKHFIKKLTHTTLTTIEKIHKYTECNSHYITD